MKRIGPLGLLAVLPLVLGGCFEGKQDTTLNPDGSGKAVIEIVMPAMMPVPPGGDHTAKPDPEVASKFLGKRMIDDSQGVDVWSDVTLDVAEDGRVTFKGTAYFKDIARMQTSEGKAFQDVTWAKDKKGDMVLTMAAPSMDSPEKPPPGAKPVRMTEEELDQAVRQAMMSWRMAKPMALQIFGQAKVESIFHLPGTVVEVNGFTKEAGGPVRFVFEEAKILDAIDTMMNDDAHVRDCIRAGMDPIKSQTTGDILEKALGFKGPMTARVTGDVKPLFDYDKEAKAAKGAYPKMIERLGLDRLPAGGGTGPGKAVPPPASTVPAGS